MFVHEASGLPEFHDDMLLVKVRPEAGALLATAGMAALTRAEAAPGLSTLAIYERAGLIRRIVPLARPAAARLRETAVRTATGAGVYSLAMAGITAAAVSAAEDEAAPNCGVSMVELQKGADPGELQMALARDATVEYVSRVPVRYLAVRRLSPGEPGGAAAVPPAASSLWNLKKIRWNEARESGLASAAEVRVGVLDTGIDPDHPDLPRPIRYVYQYAVPNAAATDRDEVGHGTHVAGTICALINNDVGINGICECALSSYKIFTDDAKYLPGLGYYAFVVDPVMYRAALAECVEDRIQVLNLSVGGYGEPDPQEQLLFQTLEETGCTVVAAMGNDGTARLAYPAAIPGVVAVGATSFDDSRASFGNYGDHIALSAPGVAIWSTVPRYEGRVGNFATFSPAGLPAPGKPIPRETLYASWQGTSMATPHVSGAAALTIAQHGPMSPADVRDRLRRATDPTSGMQGAPFSPEYGTGRLNLQKI